MCHQLETNNAFPLRNNEESASIKQMDNDKKHNKVEGELIKKTIFHVNMR